MTPEEKLSKIQDIIHKTPEYDGEDHVSKKMDDALNTILEIVEEDESEVEACKRKIEDVLEEHDCYLACDDPYCGVQLMHNGSLEALIIK